MINGVGWGEEGKFILRHNDCTWDFITGQFEDACMWLSNIHWGSNFRFKALNLLVKQNNLWSNGFIKRSPDACLPRIRSSKCYLNPTLERPWHSHSHLSRFSAHWRSIIFESNKHPGNAGVLVQLQYWNGQKYVTKSPLLFKPPQKSSLRYTVRPSSHLSKEENSVKTIGKDSTLWVCIILSSVY